MHTFLRPTNTMFDTDIHMPDLTEGKKAGIFLSGGMESTLLVKLAQEKYGEENVLCFFNDAIFCENNENKKLYLKSNIENAEKNLGIKVNILDLDYNFHVTDRRNSVLAIIDKIATEFNCEFTLWGFTKLFFEVEPFKQLGLTVEDVKRIAYEDRNKFKSTIEEFHIPTGGFIDVLLDIDIPPEVYPILRDSDGFIKSPFRHLNKAEVVDLYHKLDLMYLLFNTTSCIQPEFTNSGKHCGYCFNCQQRHDSFSILGDPKIKDETQYACDLVYERREKLEEAMKNGVN